MRRISATSGAVTVADVGAPSPWPKSAAALEVRVLELRTAAGESAASVGYRRTAALKALSDDRIAMCLGVGLAGGGAADLGLASIDATGPVDVVLPGDLAVLRCVSASIQSSSSFNGLEWSVAVRAGER